MECAIVTITWRSGRVVQGSGLLSRDRLKAVRGFESHLLRSFKKQPIRAFFVERRKRANFFAREVGFEARRQTCRGRAVRFFSRKIRIAKPIFLRQEYLVSDDPSA